MIWSELFVVLLGMTTTACAAFGLTDNDDSYVLDAGSANTLVTTINKASCDITSIVYRGTELQGSGPGTNIGSGLGSASVTATIVDWAGGMAIATTDYRRKTGVSVDIHVTYQSGAKLGDEIEIEGVAEKVGGSMAFTRIGIYMVDNGQRGRLVATGTHTKYVKGTAPQQ